MQHVFSSQTSVTSGEMQYYTVLIVTTALFHRSAKVREAFL